MDDKGSSALEVQITGEREQQETGSVSAGAGEGRAVPSFVLLDSSRGVVATSVVVAFFLYSIYWFAQAEWTFGGIIFAAVLTGMALGFRAGGLGMELLPTTYGIVWRMTGTYIFLRGATEAIYRWFEYGRPAAQVTGYFLPILIQNLALIFALGTVVGFGSCKVVQVLRSRFSLPGRKLGRVARRVGWLVVEVLLATLLTLAVNALEILPVPDRQGDRPATVAE